MDAKINLAEPELLRLTEFFKLLGDPTRVRILFLLLEKESCVGELAERLETTQSAVSHQLRILKAGRLVKNRRDGKMIYYSLDDDHVQTVIGKGLEHIMERQQ
ncbi:MAG: metalloregulator ArsR/SmtB family transcription factor [Eubacteriales bacterium]|nr:metalloregulator ArsR/SmtB family transcription factor [Eubacteriales bacterium]